MLCEVFQLLTLSYPAQLRPVELLEPKPPLMSPVGSTSSDVFCFSSFSKSGSMAKEDSKIKTFPSYTYLLIYKKKISIFFQMYSPPQIIFAFVGDWMEYMINLENRYPCNTNFFYVHFRCLIKVSKISSYSLLYFLLILLMYIVFLLPF